MNKSKEHDQNFSTKCAFITFLLPRALRAYLDICLFCMSDKIEKKVKLQTRHIAQNAFLDIQYSWVVSCFCFYG